MPAYFSSCVDMSNNSAVAFPILYSNDLLNQNEGIDWILEENRHCTGGEGFLYTKFLTLFISSELMLELNTIKVVVSDNES